MKFIVRREQQQTGRKTFGPFCRALKKFNRNIEMRYLRADKSFSMANMDFVVFEPHNGMGNRDEEGMFAAWKCIQHSAMHRMCCDVLRMRNANSFCTKFIFIIQPFCWFYVCFQIGACWLARWLWQWYLFDFKSHSFWIYERFGCIQTRILSNQLLVQRNGSKTNELPATFLPAIIKWWITQNQEIFYETSSATVPYFSSKWKWVPSNFS